MADPRLCSIPDCGKPQKARTYCTAHYQRWKKRGDPLVKMTLHGEVQHYYNSVVLHYDGDDCLMWPYGERASGYGGLYRNGKPRVVSRILCEDVNGPPPTPDHEAAHSCGNGHLGCVTKAHLSWKTPKENNDDRLIHGTHNRGERHGKAKLTESQVREIRSLKGIIGIHKLAVRFGVSKTAVADIHKGRNWGWLM